MEMRKKNRKWINVWCIDPERYPQNLQHRLCIALELRAHSPISISHCNLKRLSPFRLVEFLFPFPPQTHTHHSFVVFFFFLCPSTNMFCWWLLSLLVNPTKAIRTTFFHSAPSFFLFLFWKKKVEYQQQKQRQQ